jgi:hypothetical protein
MQRGAAILSVWVPTGAVLALINAVSLKGWLTVLLLSINVCFSLWRWRRDSYVLCRPCLQGKEPKACPYEGHRPWFCKKRL